MMPDDYSLPPRKARICRIAAGVFLLLAAAWAAATIVAAVLPGISGHCDESGCRWEARTIELLPEDERAPVTRDPAARVRYDAYVARPAVHAGLGALYFLQEGPLMLLFVSVGAALRRLGGRGDHVLAQALPWLRRAALAALAWSVAQPLAESLRAMLLFPGTPQGPYWYFPLDFSDIVPPLLLAITAYATAWALEAGVRAQRDLDDFV